MKPSIEQFAFLSDLLSLDFQIKYHKTISKGAPTFMAPEENWYVSSKTDYWNFDISINGYEIKDIVKNFKKIKYDDYLYEKQDSFRLEIFDSIKHSESKSELLNQLNFIEERLKRLQNKFSTRTYLYDGFPVDYTHNTSTKIFHDDKSKIDNSQYFIEYLISQFLDQHKQVLESTLKFIGEQIRIVEKNDKYNQPITLNKNVYDLVWNNTDTAFLELITALLETKSISNSKGPLTRIAAIDIFSRIFNITIKDPESKLTRATNRKKDVSPYLTSLKEAFDNYADRKEERLDEIRG